MKLSRKTKLALSILAALCLCAVIVTVVFHKTLFQEGNPLRLVVGITRAYFADNGIGRIPGNHEKYIMRDRPLTSFWLFMESQGWTAVDQLGSYLILENQAKGMGVTVRMWTRRFQVFEIDKIVDKNTDRSYNWSRERDFFPTKQTGNGAEQKTPCTLMGGGRSPDARYEVRVTQEPNMEPSDYSISIHAAKTGKPLFKLDDSGGVDTFLSAHCYAVWHASSEFVAVCDRGTRHTREFYVIGKSDGTFMRLRVPGYEQNALGRVNATETELYCMSHPKKWVGDDLLVTLYFAVPNPDPKQERLFFTCDVVLHLHHQNVAPHVELKSVSAPQPAEPGLPEGSL